jgi:hypothetical protein
MYHLYLQDLSPKIFGMQNNMVFDAKIMLIMMIQHAITMLITMVFDAKTMLVLHVKPCW